MLFNKIKLKKFDIYSFLLILVIFCLDRFSKIYVIKLIEVNEKELFLNNFLNITLNWNRGIGFGLLSFDATTMYHLISALILLIIILTVLGLKKRENKGIIFWSQAIGGLLVSSKI